MLNQKSTHLRRLIASVTALILISSVLSGCGSTSPTGKPSVRFQVRWKLKLSANVDSSPVIVPNGVSIDGKRQTVLLVLAGNNDSDCEPANPLRRATTYAVVASTGHILWSRSTMGPSRCTTSSPAVSNRWVYSPGLDGRIHKYALATGKQFVGEGWPERFTMSPFYEKASSPVKIYRNFLYLTTSGYTGRPGRYQGHLVVVNLSTGHEVVWNSLCSNITHLLSSRPGSRYYCPFTGSGIWSRLGVQEDPVNGNIVLVTGNGPWNGHTNWGDSVVELTYDAHHLLGTFTPRSQAYLGSHDLDLGSTAPALLPPVKWRGERLNLAVQGGKGPAGSRGGPETLWLLDRDRWSGEPGQLGGQIQSIESPYGCAVLTSPAVWEHRSTINIVYANDCGAADYQLKVEPASPKLTVKWQHLAMQNNSSPVISQSVLYIAHSGSLSAFEPATGRKLGSVAIGNVHWEYPAVDGPMVFMTDERAMLYAYRVTRRA